MYTHIRPQELGAGPDARNRQLSQATGRAAGDAKAPVVPLALDLRNAKSLLSTSDISSPIEIHIIYIHIEIYVYNYIHAYVHVCFLVDWAVE